MASRMERYYRAEERSKKNQSLYNQMNDLNNYTNIEGVVDISNSNEVSVNKIKELLNKDNGKKKVLPKKQVVQKQNSDEEDYYEEKNYDIKDILNKAKTGHSDKDLKHRNLKLHQYEILKKLKKEHPDNEEIDELLNTLALSGTAGDDLGIFDDLKSNTMVGEEASAIKKVLDEAKQSEEINSPEPEQEVEKTNLDNLDKSFYTSSFNFSNKDFDDLKSLDNNIKKNNKLIRILIIIFACTTALIILLVIAKLIF